MHGVSRYRPAIFGFALLLAVMAVAFVLIAHREWIVGVLEWIRGIGFWGIVLFVGIYAAFTVLLLPTLLFTLGAGALFGLLEGSLLVLLSILLGSSISFLLARFCLGKRATEYILGHPRLRVLDMELVREGWKFILLTRLVPFFPAKLANYFFGLARFHLGDFLIGTLFGVIPLTLLNVYIGSLIGEVAALGSGEVSRSPYHWIAFGVGLIVGIAVLRRIVRLARRAMERSGKAKGEVP